MNLSKRVAKNTLIQIIGKILSTILGLFSLALITRYLGQAGFGDYTTIINYLTIFAMVADLGLTLVTVQLISGTEDKQEEDYSLKNLFTFRLVSIVAFLIISLVISLFLPYSREIKYGILISSPYFIFPALTQIIVGLLQKRLKMGKAVIAELVSRLVLILGVIFVWQQGAGLNGVLLATLASGLASFIFHFLLAKNLASFGLAWDFAYWRTITKKSWPLAITIVLNLLYLKTDIIFLSFFKDSTEVGIYGAAYRVIDVLTTIPFMFAGLILPIITASWLKSQFDFFKNTLQRSFDFMMMFSLPLLVGGIMLAKPIMEVVAGSEFIPSGKILALLMVAVTFIFAGVIFSHAVIALDKQRKLIPYYIFTSLSALIAYFILIPRYSGVGAAIVTIYSEAVIAIFSAYVVYRQIKFFPNLTVLFKSALASIIMLLFIRLWPWSSAVNIFQLLLMVSMAGAVYIFSLFLLGGVSKEDINILLKTKTKTSINPSNDN